MKITFADIPAITRLPTGQTLVVTVGENGLLGPLAKQLDKRVKGQISATLKATPRWKGAAGETLRVPAPAGFKVPYIILMGLGPVAKLAGTHPLQTLGANIVKHTDALGEANLQLLIDLPKGYALTPRDVANIAGGIALKSYRFDKYKTKLTPEKKASLKGITIYTADLAETKRAYKDVDAQVQGIFLVRDMGNEPPNYLFPASAADMINKRMAGLGVTVEVLDEKQLDKLGFGSLLAVGKASATPPRVVVVQYKGAGNNSAPIALIGKGVTYDTGGLSLKIPYTNMAGMKYDMCGAAAVMGAITTLALRKAKVNVVAIAGFVENAVAGNAYRPDDVLTSLSGQTIEVRNTDAEGRLVLCDVLTYAQQRFKPKAMLNFATLTGAVIVALGREFAGIMSNNDDLAQKVVAAGRTSGDRTWQLPLDEAYDSDINSDIADMKNIGTSGGAGTIIGGTFLKRFVSDSVPWVHVDIAGMANSDSEYVLGTKGVTGYGVRLVDELVATNFEG